jgi:dipeptidyl aminopeptidase/acylaminoacyl peptidase
MATQHVTPELLWTLGRVGGAVASADGSRTVTTVTTYDIEANVGHSTIYDITGSQPIALTSDAASSSQPALTSDGTQLAFVRQIDATSQIHVMSTTGGEARSVTDVPIGASAPKWLPDGSGIIFLSTVYRDARDHEAAKQRSADLSANKVTAHVTEDRMYRYWDRWLTNGEIPHLCRVDLATGVMTDLTPDETAWWVWDNTSNPGEMFDVSPDGSQIAYSAMPYPDDGPPTSAVYTLAVSGAAPTEISGGHHADCSRPRFSPDGFTLIYGRQERKDFYADRTRLVSYGLDTGETTVLTEDWDGSASSWEFQGNDRIAFLSEHDAGIGVFTMPLYDATPTQIAAGGSAANLCIVGDELLVTLDSISSPGEIHQVRADGYDRLTSFNASIMDDVELSRVEDVRFGGADGAEIQMFVLYPPEFDENQQWPLVHLIHGGPHGVFGDQWHYRWNAQAIAAKGYVVAHVNFHGSTSWGQAFAESIQGEWGDRPYTDVMAATDVLCARGFIDPARMAVTGGSYGGYLTAWIVSQTDRFACAIAHAAVTNLGGMHASDVAFHRATAYGAEYWVDHERVDRWSPSTHAEGYSTPTLVIHGEKDYRVPVTQGLEFYGMLKAKGIEARLVYYPDENHWIISPQNSIHWYGEFTGWLDRFLQ